MSGVSGSVPHGGFLTLLFTGEVISLSSGILFVVVHLMRNWKSKIEQLFYGIELKLKRKRSSLNYPLWMT